MNEKELRARETIARNLQTLREEIARAATSAGRNPEDIRLIAVSKTWPWPAVEAAWRAGQKDFGESTVQEALAKIPRAAGLPLTWHFIGHVQSNKAKFIPGNFAWLHTLDSLALARRLDRAAAGQATPLKALIQVNVTGDARKHGIAPEGLFSLLEQILSAGEAPLSLRGLMTIGQHEAGDADRRHAFARLRELRDACAERFSLTDFTELSMGMSDDYRQAIAEGATMVRIGSAVFGERVYS